MSEVPHEADGNRKVFGAARRRDLDPVPFELPAGTVYYASPSMPGGVVLDLGAMAGLDTAGRSKAIEQFFAHVLMPESADQFRTNFRSTDQAVNITVDEAAEVMTWLTTEVYTGRPSEES